MVTKDVRIAAVADVLGHWLDMAESDDSQQHADTPVWLHNEAPDWAQRLMEGANPALSDDAPDAGYFVATGVDLE